MSYGPIAAFPSVLPAGSLHLASIPYHILHGWFGRIPAAHRRFAIAARQHLRGADLPDRHRAVTAVSMRYIRIKDVRIWDRFEANL